MSLSQGLGMNVLAYDVRQNPAVEAMGIPYHDLDYIIPRADVISLHVPLLPSTYHLINKDRWAILTECHCCCSCVPAAVAVLPCAHHTDRLGHVHCTHGVCKPLQVTVSNTVSYCLKHPYLWHRARDTVIPSLCALPHAFASCCLCMCVQGCPDEEGVYPAQRVQGWPCGECCPGVRTGEQPTGRSGHGCVRKRGQVCSGLRT
jgi:hypothetical protein